MVSLGYGRFVRADQIVALLHIDEGRGARRRTYVHVSGLQAPIVASRSEQAILADMKLASRAGHAEATLHDHHWAHEPRPHATGAVRRRGRLRFGARRG